jgi:hypothetical protein
MKNKKTATTQALDPELNQDPLELNKADEEIAKLISSIRHVMKQKDVTATDIANKAKLNPSVVSRLLGPSPYSEKRPRQKTKNRINEALEEISGVRSNGDNFGLKAAAVYGTMSAPCVPVAKVGNTGMLPEVSMTLTRSGPNGETQRITAPVLKRMILNKEVDCIIATATTFADIDKQIVKCARLIDYTHAVKFILLGEQKPPLSVIAESADRLKKYFSMNSALPVIYPANTAVDNWWTKHREQLGFKGRNLPLSTDDALEESTLFPRIKELLSGKQMVAVLGWEPLISSLKKQFKDKWLEIAISDRMNPPDISFDVIFRNDPQLIRRAYLNGTIQKFLQVLKANIYQINDAKELGSTSHMIIHQVSDYFGITVDECLSQLRESKFEFMLYSDWESYLDVILPRNDSLKLL